MSQPKWKKGCPPNEGGCLGMYVVCYDNRDGDSQTALVEWTLQDYKQVLMPYHKTRPIDPNRVTEYYGPIPYLDI